MRPVVQCHVLSVIPMACLAVAAPQPVPVEITGGPDATGKNYEWRVTNRYSAPIVHVAFPHYAADLFEPPPGWDAPETYLEDLGNSATGMCTATAPSPTFGIAPGSSERFRMRVANEDFLPTTGEVLIRFADDTEARVPGVKVPGPPGGSSNTALLMMGGMAVVVLLMMIWGARRQKATPES